MKKVTLLFLAIIMTVVSCGNKKNDPDPDIEDPDNEELPAAEANVLPVKIVMTSLVSTDEETRVEKTRTYTITYQQNTAMIDKITESGAGERGIQKYIYEGDLITKESRGTGTSEDYELYKYNSSGKLTEQKSFRGDKNTDLTELIYLSATKAKVTFKEWKSNDNIWKIGFQAEFNYDTKGNLIGAELPGDKKVEQVAITYDDKNSPFMNVLGWKKVRFTAGAPLGDNIGFEDIIAARNNPMKLTGAMDGKNVEVNYTYEFKDTKKPKFPTKITGAKKVGTAAMETFTAEITYK